MDIAHELGLTPSTVTRKARCADEQCSRAQDRAYSAAQGSASELQLEKFALGTRKSAEWKDWLRRSRRPAPWDASSDSSGSSVPSVPDTASLFLSLAHALRWWS